MRFLVLISGRGQQKLWPALCPRRPSYTNLSAHHCGLPALGPLLGSSAEGSGRTEGGRRKKGGAIYLPSPLPLQPQLRSGSFTATRVLGSSNTGKPGGGRTLIPPIPSYPFPGPQFLGKLFFWTFIAWFSLFLPFLAFVLPFGGFFFFQSRSVCSLSSARSG